MQYDELEKSYVLMKRAKEHISTAFLDALHKERTKTATLEKTLQDIPLLVRTPTSVSLPHQYLQEQQSIHSRTDQVQIPDDSNDDDDSFNINRLVDVLEIILMNDMNLIVLFYSLSGNSLSERYNDR